MPPRLTRNDFLERARKTHGDKYDYSKTIYKDYQTKVIVICRRCGDEFTQSPNKHIAGRGCPPCGAIRRNNSIRNTTKEFIAAAKKKHGDAYDYRKVDYHQNKTPVVIICRSCGDEFEQVPNTHLNGKGCPTCGATRRTEARRNTTKEFITGAKKKHGNLYDYSEVKYQDHRTTVLIVCRRCGLEFRQTASGHIAGQGCPDCGRDQSAQSRRKTTIEFIENAERKHDTNYDYSKVDYRTAKTKVVIICCQCGTEFKQTPNAHLLGKGCPDCGLLRRAESRRMNTEEFVAAARKKHGDKYDYSNVDYRLSGINVAITCCKCGENFEQTPNSHLSGRGCPKCMAEMMSSLLTKDPDEFIQDAKNEHGDAYDYSQVDYRNAKTHVDIICRQCGEVFRQTPDRHLQGSGCRQCANLKIAEARRILPEQFLERAKAQHGEEYDYRLVDYVDARQEVKIICEKHGAFEQAPYHHIQGAGCPMCQASRGEKRIARWLRKAGIEFE